MDLGFAMVRTWWKPLLVAWLVGVWPIAILVSLLCWKAPWLAALIIWWLKPLFDRIPLFILSRATFGDVPSARETVRGVLQLWRKCFLRDLTLGRFDPARSFDMPVRDLEGLRGKTRRQRLQVLQKKTRGSAVWLTVVCANLEIALDFSLIALLYFLLPQTVQDDFFRTFFSSTQGVGFSTMLNGVYLLAITAIEPFYVAAGFALYLNRRTLLEGWDIEIAFRRIAQRMVSSAQHLAVVVAVLLAGGLVFPAHTQAAQREVVTQTVNSTALEQRMSRVLKQPEFQTKKLEKHWKYVGKPADKKDTNPDWPWLKALLELVPGMALFLKGLLWLGVAVIVIWLIVKRKRWMGLLGPRLTRASVTPAKTLFGLDIQPQSLPENIAEEAWHLWQSGQQRAALSLLYRGALAYLVMHKKIELGIQATEGDCIRLCRACTPQATGDYFSRLTQTWQSVAYAGRQPRSEDMQQLCRHWEAHFRVTP